MADDSQEIKSRAKQRYVTATQKLLGNAAQPDVEGINASFDAAWASGEQPRRFYHIPSHYLDVAGNWQEGGSIFDALRFRAGMHHDVVYHHIDSKTPDTDGFVPEVRQTIEKMVGIEPKTNADGKPYIHITFLNESLNEKQTTAFEAAKALFGFSDAVDNHPLQPTGSYQNELLSALYAAQRGVEQGVPLKYILAEMTLIEATVPFREDNRLPQLHERLSLANSHLPLGEQLDEEEMRQTMQMAEQVANIDVDNFRGNYDQFVKNSRDLIYESIAGSVDNMDNPARLLTEMKNMQGFMKLVADTPGMCVFHSVDGSEHPDEKMAQQNLSRLNSYLSASVIGLAASIGHYMEERGTDNPPDSMSQLMKDGNFELPGDWKPNYAKPLSKPCQDAWDECQKEKETSLKTDQLAARILSILGSDALSELSEDITKLDVNNPATIKNFLMRMKLKVASFNAERRDGDPGPGINISGREPQLSKGDLMNSTSPEALMRPAAEIDAADAELLKRVEEMIASNRNAAS